MIRGMVSDKVRMVAGRSIPCFSHIGAWADRAFSPAPQWLPIPRESWSMVMSGAMNLLGGMDRPRFGVELCSETPLLCGVRNGGVCNGGVRNGADLPTFRSSRLTIRISGLLGLLGPRPAIPFGMDAAVLLHDNVFRNVSLSRWIWRYDEDSNINDSHTHTQKTTQARFPKRPQKLSKSTRVSKPIRTFRTNSAKPLERRKLQ